MTAPQQAQVSELLTAPPAPPPVRPAPYLSILLGLPLLGLLGTLGVCALVDPFGLYRWLPPREGFNAAKPRQQSHERMVRAADLTRLAPDAIILGTSRAQVGLDPDASAWSGIAESPANAAFSDGTPYEALRYLQHAHRNAKIKVAVFGADYLSFVGGVRHSPDYTEDRLATSKTHEPQPFHRWADAPSALLSLDALRISRRTVLEQDQPSYFTDRGRRNTHTMEQRIVDQEGARGAMLWSERDYADSYVCADTARLATHLKDFQALVDFAKAEQIRLVVMTSPSHIRSLELLRAAGLWSEVERFKREVAQISNQAGFAFWELGGADPLTTAEEVPPATDKTSRMRWYWESSHFNKELGDLALARVLGKTMPEGMTDWGVRVTAESLDAVLAKVSDGLDTWAAAHPGDVLELQKVVADARAAQVCRRRQP
jgi:hypothetical protein